MISFKKLKTAVYKIIPKKRFLPVIFVMAMQLAVYGGTKLIEGGRVHSDLSLPIDHALPFLPVFILFYILAYGQWLLYYLLLAREDIEIARRFLTAGVISKLICFVIFNLLPTAMQRPEPVGNGPLILLIRLIYYFDTPTNLFPSMHCVESWLCLRLALTERKLGRVPIILTGIKNFSGPTLSFLSKKQWSEKRDKLQAIEHRLKLGHYIHWRRKWAEIPLNTADGSIEHNAVYIKAHTFFTCLLSALVVLSTVFVKQHLVIDTIAGILTAEISLWLGKFIVIPGFVKK